MNPRICTVKENPPESYGDCIRACVATILDRDDVPHTFDGRLPEEAWNALREWLAPLKKTIVLFPTEYDDEFKSFMRRENFNVPYILLHRTFRGGDHAIVCRNGERIHDPAWYRSDIAGPHSIGCYIVAIIAELI